MVQYSDKAQKIQSEAAAGVSLENGQWSLSTFQLVDNRPQSFRQQDLQNAANNNPRVSQMQALQEKASMGLQKNLFTQPRNSLNSRTQETESIAQESKPVQRVLTINNVAMPAAFLGNPPQIFYNQINQALLQNYGIDAVNWPAILPELVAIANDGGNYNFASNTALVARIHNGESAADIMADYQQQGDVDVDMDSAVTVEDDKLTSGMKQRFKEAVAQFNATILAKSGLAKGKNQVVLHGVSTKSSGMKDYGSTTIYIGSTGYSGMDYNRYVELWSLALQNAIPSTSGIRIVIAVNLTINRSAAELYATLLHEWRIHAQQWAGVIEYIRSGQGRFAVAWVQAQGHVRRALGEHQAYGAMTDEELTALVQELGLDSKSAQAVLAKLKKDRDRHKGL